MKVGVIDYGVGNLGSVMSALEQLRVAPTLVTSPNALGSMDRIILPGVGNFSDCAHLLEAGGWRVALEGEVRDAGKPLLGVCVGMQLLASSSMEGVITDGDRKNLGLGLIPGKVESLRSLGCTLRVPHVGWNSVTPLTSQEGLFKGIAHDTDFYFVHSFTFVPELEEHVLARTEYGIPVVAAVRHGNVCGTQFHPEKSSRAGLRLLRNFIEGATC